jgi:hypothetical protein
MDGSRGPFVHWTELESAEKVVPSFFLPRHALEKRSATDEAAPASNSTSSGSRVKELPIPVARRSTVCARRLTE